MSNQNLSTQLSLLRRVNESVDEKRWNQVCKAAGLKPADYAIWRKGIYHFAEQKGQEGLDAVAQVGQMVETWWQHFAISERKTLEKVIFQNEETGEISTFEVDLQNYLDLKALVAIYEAPGNKVLHRLQFCDEIALGRNQDNYVRIYEGDVWRVSDEFRSEKMILAKSRKSGSVYQELLWTDKYGYLEPNQAVANTDHEELEFSIAFNLGEREMNHYAISLNNNCQLVCNVFMGDLTALKPMKQ